MRKNTTSTFLLIGVLLVVIMSCENNNNPLDKIMSSNSEYIQKIKANLGRHEVQILYTQIDRDENGIPSFTDYTYQVDPNNYFYPASTAKMPVAILALQRINELKAEGFDIDKDTPFKIWNSDQSNFILADDSTSRDGHASIAHMIKKIFLVSDNDAYNYLFDFLGRDYINRQLQSKGHTPAHLMHKFQVGADNENTYPFAFGNDLSPNYSQKSIKSKIQASPYKLNRIIKGIGYTDNDNHLINEPMDFSEKNYFSVQALHSIMKAVIFPEEVPETSRFNLTQQDYEFLRFWMSRNALESEYPNYDDGEHYDSYVKFFIYGDSKNPMPKNVRIHNKVGYAYGYLTDVSYIKDAENDIEFMITATVHVNENKIYNDGNYEYDSLGIPFLAELGRQIYKLEMTRK